MLIVALGVAFFAGLRATSIDMLITADKYYDDDKLQDIGVLCNYGFTDEDIIKLESNNNIENIEGNYYTDSFCEQEGKQYAIRIMSILDHINKVDLVDGNMPSNANECVVDSEFADNKGFSIGDTIVFSSQDGGIEQNITITSYRIVGYVSTPYYLSLERGNTSIGDGALDGFVMINEDNFLSEIYTSLSISVYDADDLLCYSDKYDNRIDSVTDEIEKQLISIARDKYSKITGVSVDKIDDSIINSKTYPKYYVVNRNTLSGYAGYKQDADRIEAVSKVFPILFFFVAALVALTTMTRMVESDRGEIGTLKALGYSNVSISLKYILYGLFASSVGSIVGVVLGQKILPTSITTAYSMMYSHLPATLTPLNAKYTIISALIAILVTTAATIFACYKELLEAPSRLMRPIAPKIGKRILLEKINIVWSRLNFTSKVTCRNIFRYKKRFFMTVFGIGGCTALMLVGFGINDSIYSIVGEEFDKISIYDGVISLSEQVSGINDGDITNIVNNQDITGYMLARDVSTSIEFNNISKDIELIVSSDKDNMNQYINLHNRITGNEYTLGTDGVIITEKLASLLGVKKGDTIKIFYDDTNFYEAKIDGISENHIYHYVYMSKEFFQKQYGEEPLYNKIYINTKNMSAEEQNQFSNNILKSGSVSGISFNDTIRDKVSKMLERMNVIIIVLIVSAGTLAFIVLYNLNNINITERQRELATIKVLGFYDGEVASYVYRENILLTIIGCALGIVLGIILHQYVIRTVELDMIMFGRKIFVNSYFYSIVLTVLFAIIVNIYLFFRLKRIDMIESLKSVE